MHEELLPLVAELERAVDARDAHEAGTIVHRLNKVEMIYSGNCVYDRLRAVERRLAVVLFEGLDSATFGQLLAEDRHFHKLEIWCALEEIGDRVGASALWDIKDYLGLPHQELCPRLFATLARDSDERITAGLIESIDRLSAGESAEGSSLSTHQRTMSAFRFVRWSPNDKGLGDCVRLLAARDDDRARAACRSYLMQLPWGADRQATVALLEGLGGPHAAQNRALLKEALAVHKQPPVLRVWLWGAIGERDPDECLMGLVADLAAADGDDDRFTFVDHFALMLSQQKDRDMSFDRSAIAAAAENVSTHDWSRTVRGYYGAVLGSRLPEANVNRVSSRLDRACISVARGWEVVRLDHMGCFIPLTFMLGGGWLAGVGLDRVLGEPVRLRWLPIVLFWMWIAWAVLTVRTHFSGHEPVASKVRMGFLYFALLLAAVTSAVIVRLG